MVTRPGLKDFFWMAVGAILLLVVMLAVLRFRNTGTPDEQRTVRARKLELVNQMRLGLASAAEAEKSAVMAITDQESQTFADQARAAEVTVEQQRQKLAELVGTGGVAGEQDLLNQFTKTFAELQRIDNELLSLAVSNTNLKASSLAFGPAAAALKEMDVALSHLATGTDNLNVLRLADDARIPALRILTLLPPHIAEESDEKMDQMEALMAQEDREVRQNLQSLAAIPGLADSPDLKTATSSYARFSDIKAQILKLSRENTNVRSLAISLNQKRKATLLCQDALAVLQQAIEREHIPGAPTIPR
ncbi:MAG TPA: hypothetical protein VL486_16655 [Verrucomicrobiae bacterium]|nr:hypothetical protein [Verrucomicrobiae bacterium]